MAEGEKTAGERAIPNPLDEEGVAVVADSGPRPTDKAEESACVPPATETGAAKADALLQALAKEREKQRLPGMRAGYLLAAWLVIVPYLGYRACASLLAGEWRQGALFILFTLLATQLHRITLTPQQTELARMLAKFDDVQAVGRLAEALEWPDVETRHLAAEALTRLLPRLKASDAALLNPAQRACLYEALTPANVSGNAVFQVAILQGLQQIGDADAVPYVQRLANMTPNSASRKWVQETAQECLPFLLERAEQRRSHQTLLRASAPAGTPSEMLLRPAGGTPETDPQKLLRASSADEAAQG